MVGIASSAPRAALTSPAHTNVARVCLSQYTFVVHPGVFRLKEPHYTVKDEVTFVTAALPPPPPLHTLTAPPPDNLQFLIPISAGDLRRMKAIICESFIWLREEDIHDVLMSPEGEGGPYASILRPVSK